MHVDKSGFTFEISLAVLNHLGRNLYRSFLTVLGEAISNSWDADSENVWIYVDKANNLLIIKDDGIGMTSEDFQTKFLKIGYSKRKERQYSNVYNRPYIGRKGIGKLALLSCAEKVSILTKTRDGSLVGGVIDNTGLDQAIKDDLSPNKYSLSEIKHNNFEKFMQNFKQGTILYFENMKEGTRKSIEDIKKDLALYFRFSLFDPKFNIFVDNEKITLDYLNELAKKTQFLWNINTFSDPYISEKLLASENLLERKDVAIENPLKGFIASVDVPKDLKLFLSGEKIGIDLFVNGRLREKDILKHIPTARIVESYLYGQIHLNELDNEIDRFTSSREGIVADDPEFLKLLEAMKKIIVEVIDDWDIWRIKHREPGDSDNKRISVKERKSLELFEAVATDFVTDKTDTASEKTHLVDGWVASLSQDAPFNFASYAECFISENLIRKYIEENKIVLSPEATSVAEECKGKVERKLLKANLSIDIRQVNNDLSYLSMDDLAYMVDNKKGASGPCLAKDADEYRPIRDALMHTSLLTNAAKIRLSAIYENIKARLKILFFSP